MIFTDAVGVQHRVVCGAIRNTGSGWFVISDSVHAPSDLAIGTVTSTYLQVTYPACSRVETFLVGPDDSFAGSALVSFGAAAGLSSAIIKGRINGAVFDPQAWSSSTANLWVYGLLRV